jgi:hypothetical protein
MKKTLLIAAAALVAGIISTTAQAQNVYSQNVVGYVNQTIPAGGFQIVGNQMINGSDANQTNMDINACLINGFVSSPNDPPNLSSNSVIYVWNGSGYAQYYFFNQADATTWEGFASPAGWYDLGGTLASVNLTLNEAAFIYNHSGSQMTITTTGNVFQGSNVVTTINAGYNLVCLAVPVSTNPASTTFGLPGNLTSSPVDPPLQSRNDTIFAWNGSGYAQYYYFNQADATTWEGFASPAGFYDLGGSLMPSSSYPTVNQGFFLYHTGSPVTWTNTFSVQ